MLSLAEAQEMHECIGAALEQLGDPAQGEVPDVRGIADALARARELAAVIVSDAIEASEGEGEVGALVFVMGRAARIHQWLRQGDVEKGVAEITWTDTGTRAFALPKDITFTPDEEA